MKKTLKTVVIVLMMISSVLCLTSCDALDDLKSRHGRFENSDRTVILYKGEKYRLLPVDEDEDYFSLLNYSLNITNNDVPALLSEVFGEEAYITEDRNIIKVCGFFYSYYCKEQLYDVVVDMIENGYLSQGYCYSYYDLDAECNKNYYLTDQQNEIIDKIVSNIPDSDYPDSYPYVELRKYSSNKVVEEYAYSISGEAFNNEFYIVDGDQKSWKVPKEYCLAIREILESSDYM